MTTEADARALELLAELQHREPSARSVEREG
jgi:hypothetical protein